jgi:hypothetical protein
VLCALAENAIAQGDFSTARFRLQAATIHLEISENKWLQTLVCYFQGLLAYYEGEAAAAVKWLGETTALARESQYKPDLAVAGSSGRVRHAGALAAAWAAPGRMNLFRQRQTGHHHRSGDWAPCC